MTREQAQQTLERYRPGMQIEAEDESLRMALSLVETDPALAAWFRTHCDFQSHVQQQLRRVPAAADLKARLLERSGAGAKILPLPKARGTEDHGSSRRLWLAAAAGLVLSAASVGVWFGRERVPDTFADYRARMVRTVLREYRMDIRSDTLETVRGYMATRGAPGDFRVPAGLGRLALAGGGFLRWRNQPVAMICYASERGDMSYLFIMDPDATVATTGGTPAARPEFSTVHGRSCAAWADGNRVYLLTGAEGVDVRTLL